MIYLDSSLNLPFVGKTEPSPYVVLEVEQQTKQTDPDQDTCEPIWDKGFTFLLRDPKRAVLHFHIHDEKSRDVVGEVFFKVDNLQNEPNMELRRHTFFCNKPHSDASICCSMKLRVGMVAWRKASFSYGLQILKNEYLEEKTEEESTKRQKMVVKQASTASNKSTVSQSTVMSSDSEHAFSDNEVNMFLYVENGFFVIFTVWRSWD